MTMFFSKLGVFAIISLCLFVGQSAQQECVAQSVANLRVVLRHFLLWSTRPAEPCDIDEFLVYIFHPQQPAEYAFTTKVDYVDISFLEVCEEWVFAVVPVSGHTLGAQSRVVAKLPLPFNADLSLAYLNMHHNPDLGRTHLQWDLADTRLGNCSLKYRVTVEVAGSPVIEDFYVDDNSLDLRFLSSCTTYQFGVRAINIAGDTTAEGPLRTEIFILPGRTQHAPRLLEADSTESTISLSFRLESEVRNPCPLRQLFIDGGSQLSQIIALSNEDRSSPVNVTIANLLPGTDYELKVYVSNTVGWSDPEMVNITTKDIEPDSLIGKKED